MSANSFGERFKITTFGESHGPAMGVVVDGCPAGVSFELGHIARELERRRPGSRPTDSARNEADVPELLSGVFEGKTLGTPIAIVVRNQDARSKDYDQIRNASRPGHADDVWRDKFGHADHRGGGRSSGRETLCRVIGGAIACMLVKSLFPETRVLGFARQIGPFRIEEDEPSALLGAADDTAVDGFVARFPDPGLSEAVSELLLSAKREGRSYGGVAEVWVDGPPPNLGQPVFRKLKADLASAILSVGATAGIEIGDGFEATHAEGSDFHRARVGEPRYGGIRGGISTGERIRMRIAFKPTSSVLDTAKKGRHDPCIVPRAIPVLEAMTWLCLADHLLWSRADRV